MTILEFLERINRAQPLSPVAMFNLGLVTGFCAEADVPPNEALFDIIVRASERQQVLTPTLLRVVLNATEHWARAAGYYNLDRKVS